MYNTYNSGLFSDFMEENITSPLLIAIKAKVNISPRLHLTSLLTVQLYQPIFQWKLLDKLDPGEEMVLS